MAWVGGWVGGRAGGRASGATDPHAAPDLCCSRLEA